MTRKYFAGVALAFTLAGCAVSQQQEVEMGQSYAQQVNQQLPIVNDAELVRYINVLGDSIADLTKRGDLDWHFYIVDSPEVNAFAIPGGFIYVNRGVIERSDRLDQLAGVIGHEIGHVVKRHSIKQMQQQQNANIGVTLACVLTSVCNSQAAQAAIQVGGAAVFAKFSRTDETEADAEGIKNVVRAGIDPNGLPEMFRKLLDERNAKGSSGGSVDAWFATHPLEEDRIATTSAIIARDYDPALIRTLTKDTQGFQNFKRRVMSLPPSPVQQPTGG
jgi:predicted Zn-dependent protease